MTATRTGGALLLATFLSAARALSQCPVINVATSTPSGSPSTLPSGLVNVAYAAPTVSQTGAVATPVTFTISAGSLPTGLSLTGATNAAVSVGGIPLSAGNFTFSLRAIDANGCFGARSYRVAVTDLCAAVTCSALDQCHAVGVCNPATGVCSNPAKSDGTSCDDLTKCTKSGSCSSGVCVGGVPAPAGTICRAAKGLCDVAETCDGTGAACPPDLFRPSNTVCRPANGPCDRAEVCTGLSAACPVDTFLPASYVCRPTNGPCDVAETCTGTAAACPADGFRPSSTVCRAAFGVCDAAEHCTGTSAACPADVSLPDGTPCNDNDVCTDPDTCQSGVCTGPLVC